MSRVHVKIIKKRGYLYRTYYVNGVQKTEYLGPVSPVRKRKVSTADRVISGVVSFGVFAVKEQMGAYDAKPKTTNDVQRGQAEDLAKIAHRQKVFAERDPKQIWERAVAEEKREAAERAAPKANQSSSEGTPHLSAEHATPSAEGPQSPQDSQ